MSDTWHGHPTPEPHSLDFVACLRILWRAMPLLLILIICFTVLLLLRLPERAVFGLSRPLTPFITQAACICACRVLAVDRRILGSPMAQPGAYVANHISWLDVFVLNASKRIYFVAKAEVEGWAGIGWLARGTGTVFIRRDRREAAAQTRLFEDRLMAGHQLLFFPEGTSTDGQQVLPFKSTLFAAFFAKPLQQSLHIQPISLIYRSPPGSNPRHYGWWGDMDFGPNLLQILATPGRGQVTVHYHTPITVSDMPSRKRLAKEAEMTVRAGVEDGLAKNE